MSRPRSALRRREGGYTAVTTIILLIPLLLVASLPIDMGIWHARADELQRGADAAALAGAPYMPDIDRARAEALKAASRNGLVGTGVKVVVEPVPENSMQIRVTATDERAPQFLSKLVMDKKVISRTGVGEYLQSVALGSPTNFFGAGDTGIGDSLGVSSTNNLWAAVNGWCAGRENGDNRLSGFDNTAEVDYYWDPNTNSSSSTPVVGGWPVFKQNCAAAQTTPDPLVPFINSDYRTFGPNNDPVGYLYAIDIPPGGIAGGIDIDVYDATHWECTSNPCTSPDSTYTSGDGITTTYTLRDPGSIVDPLKNAVISSVDVAPNDPTYQRQWNQLFTIADPCGRCTYFLQVVSRKGELNSRGANAYGVRVRKSGAAWAACSTLSSPVCPNIHGFGHMSILATIGSGGGGGSEPEFYLANVASQNAGKTMEIDLFDLGEGSESVQILDPKGNAVHFTWKVECDPPMRPVLAVDGGCASSGPVNKLMVDGQNKQQPYDHLQSSYKFNDRMLTLTVELPNDYKARYGTDTWWKVRYKQGTAPTDRTTWSVRILGSPVRLVQ